MIGRIDISNSCSGVAFRSFLRDFPDKHSVIRLVGALLVEITTR